MTESIHLPDPSDFEWTTGDHPGITHQRLMDIGGFSEVHQMLNTETNNVFARKLIRPFAGVTRADIMNEVRAIDKVCKGNHENIVRVFGHGWLTSSFYYFDMELCHLNLEQYLRHDDSTGPAESAVRRVHCYDPSKVPDILAQITSGLHYIHSQIEVHRDLKPRNGKLPQFAKLLAAAERLVLYHVDQDKWKITDFGLSAEGSSQRVHTTRYARGTASYRAPELLTDGTYNNKSDIWALGCILFELIGRKQAFSGDHLVLQYGLSGGVSPELILPEFGSNFNEKAKCVLSELMYAMLHVTGAKRPPTRDVLKAVTTGFNSQRPGHLQHEPTRQPCPLNGLLSDLPSTSELWRSVRMRRHCNQCCCDLGLHLGPNDDVINCSNHPSQVVEWTLLADSHIVTTLEKGLISDFISPATSLASVPSRSLESTKPQKPSHPPPSRRILACGRLYMVTLIGSRLQTPKSEVYSFCRRQVSLSALRESGATNLRDFHSDETGYKDKSVRFPPVSDTPCGT